MNKISRNRFVILLTIGIMILLSATSCSNIRSAKGLFTAIEKRYCANWFNNIRYMISVVKFNDDNSEKRSTCSAEYVRPSQHIIKTDLINDDGYIYRNDTIYAFKDGEMISSKQGINDFVFIVMDLYGMTADEMMTRIEQTGFVNTSEFCTYENPESKRKSYIVGVSNYGEETEKNNQIWFDTQTLLPQMVQRKRDDGHLYSISFDNYIQIGGCGWMPQKITYSMDGQIKIIERIYDAVIPIYEKTELSVENFCDNESINEMQLSPNSNFSLNFMVEP
ncbi:MAG: hypothetical protein J6T48_04375 [Bacteroidales bacterium]|nr:hypothetical protein [Bacteroidales bacterium]